MDFDLLAPLALDGNGNPLSDPKAIQVQDVAYRWLLVLFPSGDSPFGAAFQVITSSLVFLGALFAVWHILVGVISSAYSGKVLGEKFHQIYAPIRVVIGFGMVMPLEHGFSTVHYLLRDVVGVAAINMANQVVLTFYAGIPDSLENRMVPDVRTGNGVLDAFISDAACLSYVKATNYIDFSKILAKEKIQVRDDGSLEFRIPFCGSTVIHTAASNLTMTESEMKQFNRQRMEATKELRKTVFTAVLGNAELQEIFRQNTRLQISPTTVDQLTKKILETGWDVEPLRRNALEKWVEVEKGILINSNKKGLKNVTDNVLKEIRKSGFIAAGAQERLVSLNVGQAVSNMNNIKTTTRRTPTIDVSAPHVHLYSRILKRPRDFIADKTESDAAVNSADDVAGVLSTALRDVGMGDLWDTQPYQGDPVGEMILRGHRMLQVANLSIMATLAADFVGGTGGVVKDVADYLSGGILGGLGAVAARLVSFLGYLIVFLIIIGFLFAYILPVIPFIMVVMTTLSWLLMFIEAAVASVLWAFTFIRMDGQELFDRAQSPGVGLLFNLLMRPAVGMAVFCAASLLVPEMLRAVSILWHYGASSMYADQAQSGYFSLNWLWGWIASIMIFSWISWQIYVRIYGLVPTIADRIGGWMGFGQTAGYDGNETAGATNSIVGITNRAQGAPIMGGGGPKGRAMRKVAKIATK
ncbi:DotA/TraY family protein [Pseudovibrio ascidiaceicola]|uniref:DotA/TraY family protein n=1 Tax=Pseudovibrio ascidiaceicola TaxID=285279 RepID=UPI003D36561F